VASAIWDWAISSSNTQNKNGMIRQRGFSLNRPPGHHATKNRGMGFCLLNNVAIAAEYLIRERGAVRVAIVDLDLHHGNGTQDIFWQRRDVLYISTHQSPLYPGTGMLEETGEGYGRGYTANFPLPPASGDRAYQTVMGELILPLIDRYEPEMILVSAGFDAHWRDPLGHMRLSADGYYKLIAELRRWADIHCGGRISLVLEGGYDLGAIGTSAQAAAAALLEEPWEDPIGPSPRLEGSSWQSVVRKAKDIWAIK
jgi:acetoin utilization deacetylase AcuC-like enzyme